MGVEYEPSASFQPQIALSKPVSRIVKARRLVVVSAGALGSPAILERSGIGSVELLSSLGVDVISELPAVGEHYQDHHLLLDVYPALKAIHRTYTSQISLQDIPQT